MAKGMDKKTIEIPEDKDKLLDQYKQYKMEYRKMRFDHVMGELGDTSKIKKHKKHIAKLLTKLNALKDKK